MFSIVFFKTISVLLSVIIGLLAGKYSKVQKDSIASLLFYFISPIVFFAISAKTVLTIKSLSIIIASFSISTILSIFSYYFFNKYWKDYTLNIITLSAGSANCGYFMLPIVTTLFDESTLSIYTMAVIGVNIFEYTVGYYICNNNLPYNNTNNILNIIKLPILNGFLLGCLYSYSGFKIPHFLDDFIENMRGSFSILGMVMLGLTLATSKKFTIDYKFTIATFISKFIFYPIAISLFIMIDKFILGFYNNNVYNALKLLSVAPIASNIIVISNIQKFQTEKIAATVFLSLIFAIFYIPLITTLF